MKDIISILDKRKRPPFTMIDNKVLEATSLDAYEKLTYIILCKFANWELQTCFPSLKTLMSLVGCQKPKILKCLKKLKSLGLIDIERRTKGNEHISNLYTLLDLDGVVIDNYHRGNIELPPTSNPEIQPSNLELPEHNTTNETNNSNNNLSDEEFETLDDMIRFYSTQYNLPFENVLDVYDRCINQRVECNINRSFTDYFVTALQNEQRDYKLTKFIKRPE